MSSNPSSLTVRCKVHFQKGHHGQLEMKSGSAPNPVDAPAGRVPKLARLMALAIKFQGMLERGEVKDQAELARVGHVSRARVTQIMNLSMLAPDIQEEILFLPPVVEGGDQVKEWQVRVMAAEPVWGIQRRLWTKIFTPARVAGA